METGLAAALTTDQMKDSSTETGNQKEMKKEMELEMEKELWPKDVKLYQPPEEDQILLPERASCLAVKTYLRMCNLPFTERSCVNAEFMSTEGRLSRLPLLRLGGKLLTEFEPIVGHVEQMLGGKGLSSWLDEEEREDMRSLVTYMENTCTLTEFHTCFLEEKVYDDHTRLRNGAAHPWPLSTWRRHDKRQEALRLLHVYQWDELSGDRANLKLNECLQLLDDMLKEKQDSLEHALTIQSFIYGKQLCELDALIYGHLTAILTTVLPNPLLALTVRKFPRLVTYCRRIDEQFHGGKHFAGED
ncbi:metaxin-2 [Drosophila innubila]|uniref:metaxin-2 n=1 Tax=Drosophila innubila TaxID=198719 RepID=UPI00148DC1AF|nr:metaxin-2 [Drosophila innubila]